MCSSPWFKSSEYPLISISFLSHSSDQYLIQLITVPPAVASFPFSFPDYLNNLVASAAHPLPTSRACILVANRPFTPLRCDWSDAWLICKTSHDRRVRDIELPDKAGLSNGLGGIIALLACCPESQKFIIFSLGIVSTSKSFWNQFSARTEPQLRNRQSSCQNNLTFRYIKSPVLSLMSYVLR